MLKHPPHTVFAIAYVILFAACNASTSQQTKQISDFGSRATAGDSVWIYLNHVKADQRQEFEKFIHEVFFDSAVKLSPSEQQVFKQTRILHPVAPEADGSYTYVFLMDPVLSGGDYDIGSLLTKIYGESKGSEEGKKLGAMQTSDQTGYVLVQSRH